MFIQSESFRKRDKEIAIIVQKKNKPKNKFLKKMKEKIAVKKTFKHEIMNLGFEESEKKKDNKKSKMISAESYYPSAMSCKYVEFANKPSSE